MRQAFRFLLLMISILFISCSDDDDYQEISSPVNVDLTQVPYPKLSDYQFFSGALKNQIPSPGVLPFKPTSELFTDYASKKRFVWMPDGTTATYSGDENVLELPVGSALLKTFYYDQVQPGNTPKIIETRLLIRKQDGWITANYIWNDDQTDAFLDTEGATVPLTFTRNGVTRSIDYQVPGQSQCAMCHTNNSVLKPIGIKPQNLNSLYNYGNGSVNQLLKWKQQGYLESVPQVQLSTVDYSDASQDINLRVRSYLDINCAHCHSDGGATEFLLLRFAYHLTNDIQNMGVCESALMQPPGIPHGWVVKPGDISQSVLHYTMSTTASNYKMPRIGRTIVHDEAVEMIEAWINQLPECE